MKLKYIILELKCEGFQFQAYPFLFSGEVTHSNMAEYAQHALIEEFNRPFDSKELSVVSAGFYDLHQQKCHGKSESLGLESRGHEDDSVICRCNSVGYCLI